MSRIGKQPINIPDNVEVTLDNSLIKVKGPKGQLELSLPTHVIVKMVEKQILVTPKNSEDSQSISLWGTIQRLISNLVIGVTDGFEKKLSTASTALLLSLPYHIH